MLFRSHPLSYQKYLDDKKRKKNFYNFAKNQDNGRSYSEVDSGRRTPDVGF